MKLRLVKIHEVNIALEIINDAKKHLKQQAIDQWQAGYLDYDCIEQDIENEKGYFIADKNWIWGYLCIDYDGESAYSHLNGKWLNEEKYVVVHRMAFIEDPCGKGISDSVLCLVEEMSREKGIYSFRMDTDGDNHKMQHILKKNGFTYRGTIWFDNSEKIAFDKSLI